MPATDRLGSSNVAGPVTRKIRSWVSSYFPEREVVGLATDGGAPAHGCRLDPDRLAGLAVRLTAAIENGADLVIINRFGRSEAEGKGLIDLVPMALDADIPVLIAVPERRFSAWIRFSEGMNVRLACRRDALDQWWHRVGGPPCGRNSVPTLCEFAK